MSGTLIELIEQKINQQRMEALWGRKSDPIYLKKHKEVNGFEYEPVTIYFTYIGFDASKDKVRVEHYFWPGGDPDEVPKPWNPIPLPPNGSSPSELKTLITMLAQNASDGSNNPRSYAKNFNNIQWRRKSYMVFFFDDIRWKLHRFQNGTEAVVFYEEKFETDFTPNHTFYDAIDFEKVTITKNGTDVDGQAVAFINHMKQADGSDLGPTPERYEFGMYFDVEFSGGSSKKLTFVIDPGGTNQGPPLEP